MKWSEALGVLAAALEEDPSRQVLLALPGATYEVKEILPGRPDDDLLAFVVYRDDEARQKGQARRTAMLLVPPDRIQRLVLQEGDEGGFGF